MKDLFEWVLVFLGVFVAAVLAVFIEFIHLKGF